MDPIRKLAGQGSLVVDTRIKVEILLKKVLPKSVLVEDDEGNEVRIWVEYPRLPPKCDFCNEFGHLYHRCPTAPDISVPPTKTVKSMHLQVIETQPDNVTDRPTPQREVAASNQTNAVAETEGLPVITLTISKDQSVPAQSTHSYFDSPANDSPNEWQVVTARSKVHKIEKFKEETKLKNNTVSDLQSTSEEEAIQIGQCILRRRSGSSEVMSEHQQQPSYSKKGGKTKTSERTYAKKGTAIGKVGAEVQSLKKVPPKALTYSNSGRSPGKGRPHHLA